MEYLINLFISLIPLFISVIIASIYHKKVKGTPLKYLTYYLWFLIFFEIIAYLLAVKYRTNILWYNIAINIGKIFFLSLFYQYIKHQTVKKIIIIGAVLYELFFFSYAYYTESWHLWQSFSGLFGSIIVILAVFAFLIEMFQSDKVLFVKEYLIFWVAIAVLFYYIVSAPYDITNFYYQREGSTGFDLGNIQIIVSSIMYLLIAYGFIWNNKPYK